MFTRIIICSLGAAALPASASDTDRDSDSASDTDSDTNSDTASDTASACLSFHHTGALNELECHPLRKRQPLNSPQSRKKQQHQQQQTKGVARYDQSGMWTILMCIYCSSLHVKIILQLTQ